MCFNTIRQLASEGRYSKEAFLASDYEKREDLEDQNVCRTVGAAVLARGTKTDEKEYKAKILAVDQKKGKVHVHFQGWRSKFDEWVPFKNVRTERQKQKADRAEQERLSEADLEELPSARSPEEEPEKNPLTVDWDAFENDVALIVKNSLKSHPVSDEVGTVYHAAQKLQTCSTKVISAAKEKQARETRELCVTELVDRVARENREPAMQEWRKEPFATANSKNTSRPVKSRQTKLKRDCQHSKSVRRRLRLETNYVARWALRLHVMRVYASRASGRADDRRTRWRYLVGVWLEA